MTYLNWGQKSELKVQLGHLLFVPPQRFSFLPHIPLFVFSLHGWFLMHFHHLEPRVQQSLIFSLRSMTPGCTKFRVSHKISSWFCGHTSCIVLQWVVQHFKYWDFFWARQSFFFPLHCRFIKGSEHISSMILSSSVVSWGRSLFKEARDTKIDSCCSATCSSIK